MGLDSLLALSDSDSVSFSFFFFLYPRTLMYALKDGAGVGGVSDFGCWVLQCSRVFLMYQCANREL